MGPAATELDQQRHIELPEKTLGLCESINTKLPEIMESLSDVTKDRADDVEWLLKAISGTVNSFVVYQIHNVYNV